VLSALLAVIGVVLIVKWAAGDGGASFVLGALFLAAGLGRLYLSVRSGPVRKGGRGG
jgi:hypothetical protein